MSIRAPTANLATPKTIPLKKSAIFHRVHDRTFAGDTFNLCKGSPTRFAPITEKSGTCVPSLYAGNTLESAIYETVFHDVPAKALLKTVPMQNVLVRAHSTLEVMRPLTLASLRTPDLKRWRLTRNALISSSPKLYGQTARWAEAIHRQFLDIDGLIWTSNQCDPDDAYLFFGDRVAPSDFKIITTRDGLADKTLLADIRTSGTRANIFITT